MPRLPSVSDVDLTRNVFDSRDRNSMIGKFKSLTDDFKLLVNNKVQNFQSWYYEQPKWKQIGIVILAVIAIIFHIVLLVFYKKLIGSLLLLADKWHELSYGRLLLFTLVFFVGFPPLIGFLALSMLTGMVYGFLGGWPILATASISGSFVSFLVYRFLLHNQAERLIHSNEKFRAFSEILKEDQSLLLLVLIRLCPLPYSLSNGALAAVPNLPALTYLLASVITSPKLLIHTFVGHKMKELGDDKKSSSSKVFDIISIVITGLAASVTTFIIYSRMQKKLRDYHSGFEVNDSLIFGNFGDDVESNNNVELNSADFDADNFIIEDEDEADDQPQSKNLNPNNGNSNSNYDEREWDLNDDDLGADDFDASKRSYRDH